MTWLDPNTWECDLCAHRFTGGEETPHRTGNPLSPHRCSGCVRRSEAFA